MLEGKALIEDTDMPVKMQNQAMACASEALDLYDVFDCRSIAAHIKKVHSFTNTHTHTQRNMALCLIYSFSLIPKNIFVVVETEIFPLVLRQVSGKNFQLMWNASFGYLFILSDFFCGKLAGF
uniref:Uncharacterized protein MANES_04G129300 n=1 Tax=Rhizophora mucronata TaxID=61149 RepID=A0A2P2KL30_RHIMU